MNAATVDDAQIRSLVEAAEGAFLRGEPAESARLLSTARSLSPDHPAVLGASGAEALRGGDAARAKILFERALERERAAPGLWLNLATALRALNDAEGETRVLQQALALDPYFFPALIQKASLLERLGKARLAARAYQNALQTVQPGAQLPRAWQPLIDHAQRTALAGLEELGGWLDERMQDVRERHRDAAQERVDECLGAIIGRKRIYVQQPTAVYFPRLPAIPFYDRRDFPWLAAVEAATDGIRDELTGLLQQARDQFTPYLTHASDAPLNQWRELNQARRWSALFLYRDGEAYPQNLARCPQTVAALSAAPVVKIPHRGPTWLFSLLEPHTRLPAHTGSTNTRLTVHIPLVIPPNCGFRVGSEVREWQPGTALVFDDTIEHEAWNDSDQERVILIFDIWNPLMTQAEQDLMAVASAAMAEFYADP